MKKKLYVVLGSEKSGDSFQTICQAYNQQAPEVGILGVEGPGTDSASLVIVTYEGGGAFSIRSQKGSKITIRGGKPHKPFIPE
ncbi:MAG: hypothetical protein ACFFCW_48970 [Candidatus Hodarchaeota archaeon]|jgi:hypothetical protein